MNPTVMVQVAAAASTAGQLLVWLNPAPASVMAPRVKGPGPPLVSVTVCFGAELPLTVEPKVNCEADTVNAGSTWARAWSART